jgi:integrase
MPTPTICIRIKASKDKTGRWIPDAAGGWQYVSLNLGAGRRPVWLPEIERIAKSGGRGFQYRRGNAWSEQFSTIREAEKAAAEISEPLSARRDDNGDPTEGFSLRRAVEQYLDKKAKKSPATVSNYTHILNEFLANLPRGVRTVEQVNGTVLMRYQRWLEDTQKAAPKTVVNKLMVICFLLKASGVTNPSRDLELPTIEDEIVEPYSADDLQALFSNMTDEETVRYRFFLDSACREQEVQVARWEDIDWKKHEYLIRPKVWKSPAGAEKKFTPKNHKSRRVPLTRELVDLLRKRKGSNTTGWIFPNADNQPDGHMLRKFKAIAKKANLNCGDCETTLTETHLGRKRVITASCLTRPVCERHYLHRLRKTRATFWHENGVSLRTIQEWLSHASLETTMKYLGIQDSQKLQKEINAPMYRVAS